MSLKVCLVPPSPVTNQVPVEIRASVSSIVRGQWEVAMRQGGKSRILCRKRGDADFYRTTIAPSGWSGDCRVEVRLRNDAGAVLAEQSVPLTVIPAKCRSTGLLGGAWCGLYHWSEEEGRLWNRELAQFTDEGWRGMVRDMHRIGMNGIVLQELFRNQEYYGKHSMETTGYHGKAFYPSQLFPGRMPIACSDPVEAILSEADRLEMNVFAGVGMYAWFDFTPGSLDWHKRAAREIFARYGKHPSLYGWYVSEEVFGNLNYGPRTEEDIVRFFHEFSRLRDELSPAMPVMLAPNCFELDKTPETWKKLMREVDILCPFGFNRMPPGGQTPEEAFAFLQKIADEAGCHLWLDLEAFLFHEDQSLYPRPVESIAAELNRFSGFEKVFCYQYPGVFSSPEARLHPGGRDAVCTFQDYRLYYCEHRNQA